MRRRPRKQSLPPQLMLSPMIDMIFCRWYFYRRTMYERNKTILDQVAGMQNSEDRKQKDFATVKRFGRIVSKIRSR